MLDIGSNAMGFSRHSVTLNINILKYIQFLQNKGDNGVVVEKKKH